MLVPLPEADTAVVAVMVVAARLVVAGCILGEFPCVGGCPGPGWLAVVVVGCGRAVVAAWIVAVLCAKLLFATMSM